MYEVYPFQLKELPYAYDALEPYIDEKTMHLHHDRHLKTYIDNLNAVLAKHPEYQNMSLSDLLTNCFYLKPEIQKSILNNAGGVFNHELYFDLMQPHQKSMLSPYREIQQSLIKKYGSMHGFKKLFKEAALKQFGSGYTWLAINPDCELFILNTSNQFTPLPYGYHPLLLIDVWEHAYYLKHYNVRSDYIDNWFEVVNWDQVNNLFLPYIAKNGCTDI